MENSQCGLVACFGLVWGSSPGHPPPLAPLAPPLLSIASQRPKGQNPENPGFSRPLRARPKGTTALRHHQDGKGSSSQPTGYAVHVTPYLCAEKFIKSLTTDVRLGGGFFVCAQAARGPFPNARSACTCGGPAQRCCLLNATETEDPLLIHSMKLPFSRPQRADQPFVVYLAKEELGHQNPRSSVSRCTAPSSTSCAAAT